jgi:hypothetical protein
MANHLLSKLGSDLKLLMNVARSLVSGITRYSNYYFQAVPVSPLLFYEKHNPAHLYNEPHPDLNSSALL